MVGIVERYIKLLRLDIHIGAMFYGTRTWVERIYPYSVGSIFLSTGSIFLSTGSIFLSTVSSQYYRSCTFYNTMPNDPINGAHESRENVYYFCTPVVK